jgi:hypothetical protein
VDSWQDVRLGCWTVFLILNEIARHAVTTFGLLASAHLVAGGVEWVAQMTGTSILKTPIATLPVLGPIEVKQLLLTIDAVFIVLLASEGFRDILRIYGSARKTHR